MHIIIYGIFERESALIIFEQHANLKYKYGNRAFWCTGYYVSTVGNNKTVVYRYIENKLKEDLMTDQITIKEYKNLFRVLSSKDARDPWRKATKRYRLSGCL